MSVASRYAHINKASGHNSDVPACLSVSMALYVHCQQLLYVGIRDACFPL
ncbi:MAG: hypothetical protein H0V01_07630 [Bacteroidetes bacterium]|nr:hypothetical protein [Bacteroidota bacterium]HET6243113.1 hypothetical protein [Bacteroidia bacterium]